MLACMLLISLFTVAGTKEVGAAVGNATSVLSDSKTLFSQVVKNSTDFYYQTIVKNANGTINHIATYYSGDGGRTKEYLDIIEFLPGTVENDIIKMEGFEKKFKMVYELAPNPNVSTADYKNQYITVSHGRDVATDYKSAYLMSYYKGATYNNKSTFIQQMFKQDETDNILGGVLFQQGTGNITMGLTFYLGTKRQDVFPDRFEFNKIMTKKDVTEYYNNGFILDCYQLTTKIIEGKQVRNKEVTYFYSMHQLSQYEILDSNLGYTSLFPRPLNKW